MQGLKHCRSLPRKGFRPALPLPTRQAAIFSQARRRKRPDITFSFLWMASAFEIPAPEGRHFAPKCPAQKKARGFSSFSSFRQPGCPKAKDKWKIPCLVSASTWPQSIYIHQGPGTAGAGRFRLAGSAVPGPSVAVPSIFMIKKMDFFQTIV